jgi:hypothetical protein
MPYLCGAACIGPDAAKFCFLLSSYFNSYLGRHTMRKTYRTREEAKADVFDYIECFYNPKQRHSTIGHLIPSPIDQNPCAHWRNPMDMMRHG